jgi:molecular chaperone GrpE
MNPEEQENKENMAENEVKDTNASSENVDSTQDQPLENQAGVGEETIAGNEIQEDWKNKYYYLAADFDNYRRNQAKERRDLLATAAQGVIKDLLPILDNFERAIKANEQLTDIEAIKEGFQLIYQGLSNGLNKHGLKEIESNGQIFNSDIHEAIAQIPAPQEELKGKIIDTVEKGYTLNEKVIRFAKVAVGS